MFNESLRMYPPTPAVSRQAQPGLKLAGYSIPQRTKILVNKYKLYGSGDSIFL